MTTLTFISAQGWDKERQVTNRSFIFSQDDRLKTPTLDEFRDIQFSYALDYENIWGEFFASSFFDEEQENKVKIQCKPWIGSCYFGTLKIQNCNSRFAENYALNLLAESELAANDRNAIYNPFDTCVGEARFGITSFYLNYGPRDAILKVDYSEKIKDHVPSILNYHPDTNPNFFPFYIWDIYERAGFRPNNPYNLTGDLWINHIFIHLDLYELVTCRLVCKFWNLCAINDKLWKEFVIKRCMTFDLPRVFDHHFTYFNSGCSSVCRDICQKQHEKDCEEKAELEGSIVKDCDKLNEYEILSKIDLIQRVTGYGFHNGENGGFLPASTYYWKDPAAHLCTDEQCRDNTHWSFVTKMCYAKDDLYPATMHFFKFYVKRQAYARLYNLKSCDIPVGVASQNIKYLFDREIGEYRPINFNSILKDAKHKRKLFANFQYCDCAQQHMNKLFFATEQLACEAILGLKRPPTPNYNSEPEEPLGCKRKRSCALFDKSDLHTGINGHRSQDGKFHIRCISTVSGLPADQLNDMCLACLEKCGLVASKKPRVGTCLDYYGCVPDSVDSDTDSDDDEESSNSTSTEY